MENFLWTVHNVLSKKRKKRKTEQSEVVMGLLMGFGEDYRYIINAFLVLNSKLLQMSPVLAQRPVIMPETLFI